MEETATSCRAAPYLTRTVISGGGGLGGIPIPPPPPPAAPAPSSRACTTIPLGRTSHPALSSPAADAAAASDHPLLDPPSELDRCITAAMDDNTPYPPPITRTTNHSVRGVWCSAAAKEEEGKGGVGRDALRSFVLRSIALSLAFFLSSSSLLGLPVLYGGEAMDGWICLYLVGFSFGGCTLQPPGARPRGGREHGRVAVFASGDGRRST